MSNQKPLVGVGTELPQGTVVSINHDCVTVEKNGAKSTLDFTQVEKSLQGDVTEAKALETSYAEASKALDEASSRATEAEKRAAELTEGRKHRVVALRKAEAARKATEDDRRRREDGASVRVPRARRLDDAVGSRARFGRRTTCSAPNTSRSAFARAWWVTGLA